MEQAIKNLLLRSMTEELPPEEAAQLEAALSASETLRQEQRALLQTKMALQSALPPADPAFVDRVMIRLDRKRKDIALVVQLFPRVAAACAIVLVALTLFLYFEAGSLSADALVGLEDLSIDDAVALTEY
jgi:anti-sigma factor RsiW